MRKQFTVVPLQLPPPAQPPWPSSKTSHLVFALQREQHSATLTLAVGSV